MRQSNNVWQAGLEAGYKRKVKCKLAIKALPLELLKLIPGLMQYQAIRDTCCCYTGRLTGTLLGILSIPSLPLSVEGQVHRLIEEATDKENLGKMYVWWMAWF